MQGKGECQKVLMRGQGIFKKFLLRGGGEGYFADDERGWGVTPSAMHGVVLCCVVLCCAFMFCCKCYQMSTPKNTLKYFTYSKIVLVQPLKTCQKRRLKIVI